MLAHITRHNCLDDHARNGRREKEQRKANTTMGDGHHIDPIRFVRLQQQAEWRGTGIDFAKTFGQRCPEDDVLSEEMTYRWRR